MRLEVIEKDLLKYLPKWLLKFNTKTYKAVFITPIFGIGFKYKALKINNKYNYYFLKDEYVSSRTGKKLKLRKYISDLARKLQDFNQLSYKENRLILISSFELDGLNQVVKDFNKEVNLFTKKQKQ